MQPARIKLHAKEHTNNPVQRPHFRGHALTKRGGRVLGNPPEEGNLGQSKNKAQCLGAVELRCINFIA